MMPATIHRNALTQAAAQLAALFPADAWEPGEYIEVRCLDASTKPAARGPRGFFSNHGEALLFAMRHREAWDVFVGVGWRRCPVGAAMPCRCRTQGGNSHVGRLTAAYADLDIGKAGESVDAILAQLLGERQPPTMIIASGGGLHAYWQIAPTADIERVRAINRGLARRFGCDSATDPARVLRLAGTTHRKQQPAQPVRLLRYQRREVRP